MKNFFFVLPLVMGTVLSGCSDSKTGPGAVTKPVIENPDKTPTGKAPKIIPVQGGTVADHPPHVAFSDYWVLVGHPPAPTLSLEIAANGFGYPKNSYYANGTLDSIAYTTDAGATWMKTEQDCSYIRNLIMHSPTEYLVYGKCNDAFGVHKFNPVTNEIEMTRKFEDNGWNTNVFVEVGGVVHIIKGIDEGNSEVYTSTDFGSTWDGGTTFAEDAWGGMKIAGPGTLTMEELLEDDIGDVYSSIKFSTNKGATFGPSVNLPTEGDSYECSTGGTCILSGYPEYKTYDLYSTVNLGATWTKLHSIQDSTKGLLHSIFVSGDSFMAMQFTTETKVYFNDDYHVYWSIDKGKTWKMTSLADKEQMESIHHSANGGYYLVVSYNREELFGEDQVNLYRLKP